MIELFIPLSEPFEARRAWQQSANRLGVAVTGAAGSPHVLAITNNAAQNLANMEGLQFFSAQTHDILVDSLKRPHFMPAVMGWQPASPDEALKISGPLFVKPRTNLLKSPHPLAYTHWPSAKDFVEHNWPTFEQANVEPMNGLILSQDLGLRVTNIEVDFAVSAAGEIYVMHVFDHDWVEHNRPTDLVLRPEGVPAFLFAAIQALCTNQKITGGIFNVQAVQSNGVWLVMDWNTRPLGVYRTAAGLHPGVGDAGLAHMLGLRYTPPPVCIEIRSYWDRPIPNSQADAIRSLGLTPSWAFDKRVIGLVYGVADTKEQVYAQFKSLEELLA